jgi:hypothetical protein
MLLCYQLLYIEVFVNNSHFACNNWATSGPHIACYSHKLPEVNSIEPNHDLEVVTKH